MTVTENVNPSMQESEATMHKQRKDAHREDVFGCFWWASHACFGHMFVRLKRTPRCTEERRWIASTHPGEDGSNEYNIHTSFPDHALHPLLLIRGTPAP